MEKYRIVPEVSNGSISTERDATLSSVKTDDRNICADKIASNVHAPLKRTIDICLALAMIVVFAPLMILIALMVWREDGAPILYRHRRIGKDGKPFHCLKYRTMVRNSDEVLKHALAHDPTLLLEWERNFKLEKDPRILGEVGHLLRRASLDELPQLFNVLWGDMSLVGPRPVIENEVERYGRYRNHYTSVKPGLTGPWQVGGRSETTYEERVNLDVWYIEHPSVWRDLSILWRTVVAFITGQLGGAK
ncbi:sugar transferase [Alloyangia pacifica]|uniref:Sugar transferase involved in LPS biosynthesis (Colanic, teichoic acid) n=1 Tax=Alloyangia pacifica TaxID=311180 RepID=A0A1I6WE61_9RHOB|nr:sugar transferase [Alloyangia pacifica]SDI62045.1 Sugar transferase involved in LPS biosynthesis (colanic, teichoic acid) [Alloyangia pacifica]SFT24276.1 Sugar transferase involved in LPS biosynthesis (colanic, teichoic acid) [Alloyangia pacifica]